MRQAIVWTRRLSTARLFRSPAALGLIGTCGLSLALWAIVGTRAADPDTVRLRGAPRPETRLREGTAARDWQGRFEVAGERVTFYSLTDQPPVRVLENLALERVARVLADGANRRTWVVQGVLTEYQGANYLLLQRATLRDATPSAAPSRSTAEKPPGK